MKEVVQTQDRSGWSVRKILEGLGVEKSSYYRWLQEDGLNTSLSLRQPYEILSEEKDIVIRYALQYPSLSHRVLAWKMVDEDVVYVSPSTVYRLLSAENLVCRQSAKRTKRYRENDEKAGQADERWQTDIHYIKINERNYYLISFMDEYSRYIVSWELMAGMDKDSVSLAAQSAVEKLAPGVQPTIQSDNAKSYLSRDFKIVLSQKGIGHNLIHPHCPEENGLIERWHRTLDEACDEEQLKNLFHGREVIGELIKWYNEERMHSALNYLRPIDYYRGNPEKLLAARNQKLMKARQERREKNLTLRQKELTLNYAAKG
jgi:transposase InsO family protein